MILNDIKKQVDDMIRDISDYQTQASKLFNDMGKLHNNLLSMQRQVAVLLEDRK